MSSAEDLAVIRRCYELGASGDLDGLLEHVSEDAEWVPPEIAPEPGPFRGKEEIRRSVESYFETFERFWPQPEEILAGSRDDEYVVLATTHVRGRGSGVPAKVEVAHLITLREGRVTRFQVFVDRGEAFAAAGIAPLDQA